MGEIFALTRIIRLKDSPRLHEVVENLGALRGTQNVEVAMKVAAALMNFTEFEVLLEVRGDRELLSLAESLEQSLFNNLVSAVEILGVKLEDMEQLVAALAEDKKHDEFERRGR